MTLEPPPMTNHPIERETHPLLERVAKAIAENDCAGLRRRGIQAETKNWRLFIGDARAALSALRDLTPDVVEAGWEAISGDMDKVREDVPAAFTAMLNTIIGSDAR